MTEIVWNILTDGAFAAMAAVGFGAISDPPMRAFTRIALLAAAGHALRYTLMTHCGADIAAASLCASALIGFGSLLLGRGVHCPTTVLSVPALLPMVPGMYAYRSVFAIIMFFQEMGDAEQSVHHLNSAMHNGFVTVFVILMLAVGATLPILLFPDRAHTMTRRKNYTRTQTGK